jgi:hypothetical protein
VVAEGVDLPGLDFQRLAGLEAVPGTAAAQLEGSLHHLEGLALAAGMHVRRRRRAARLEQELHHQRLALGGGGRLQHRVLGPIREGHPIEHAGDSGTAVLAPARGTGPLTWW